MYCEIAWRRCVFPSPVAAVDEQRVVRLRRRFRDCERGRVGEAVRRADHERIERVLRVQIRVGRLASLGRDARGLQARPPPDGEDDLELFVRRLAHRGLDQLEEMAGDPRLGEVVRRGDREGVVRELDPASFSEPGLVGGLVERLPQPCRNVTPEARVPSAPIGAPSPSDRLCPPPCEAAILAPSRPLLNVDNRSAFMQAKQPVLQGFIHSSQACPQSVDKLGTTPDRALFAGSACPAGLWITSTFTTCLY